MRVQINLATHPYEDTRAFYSRWITTTVLLAVAAVLLTIAAGIRWHDIRNARRALKNVGKMRAAVQEEQKKTAAVLARPENRATRDQIVFLNDLLAQKSLSWTQVFSDLESLMPRNVHVQAIQPKFGLQNDLELHITAIGNSQAGALAFLRNLEQSDHFRQPRLHLETHGDHEDRGVIFEIATAFLPEGRGGAR